MGKSPLHQCPLDVLSVINRYYFADLPTGPERKTPGIALRAACKYGYYQTVLTLLQKPTTNINEANSHGQTALHKAAVVGFDLICGLLLEHGIKIDTQFDILVVKHRHPTTALWLAADQGHVAVVAKLLEYSADASLSTGGVSPLGQAC